MAQWIAMAVLLLPLIAQAGGVVENGGDSVRCVPSTQNKLNGTYVLDFIMNPWAENSAPLTSYTDNFEKLIPLLQSTYPILANSLSEFYSHLFKDDLGESQVWKPHGNGLISIDDQALLSKLPANCARGGTNVQVLQTVIREQRGNQIVYNYDPTLVDELKKQPLQLSYLLFHEWLWTYFKDISALRDANAVIHSSDWSRATVDKKIGTLKRLGLDLPLGSRVALLEIRLEGKKPRVFYEEKEVEENQGVYSVKLLDGAGETHLILKQSSGVYLSLVPGSFEVGGPEHPLCSVEPQQPKQSCDAHLGLNGGTFKIVAESEPFSLTPAVFVLQIYARN